MNSSRAGEWRVSVSATAGIAFLPMSGVQKKAAAYRAHFGGCEELKEDDVANLTTRDLPGVPDLIWGSFPCQDLSLAGNGLAWQANAAVLLRHSGNWCGR
jgi:site-specific DNA-cytosine methylase